MDIKRIALYAVVAILGLFLFNAWMHDYPPKPATVTASQAASQASAPEASPTTYSPTTFSPASANQPVSAPLTATKKQLISVKTNVLDVAIDPSSGDIVSASLPKYSLSLTDKTPVQILSADQDNLYILQSGLTDLGKKGSIQYSAEQNQYVLPEGQRQLMVTLTGRSENGLTVRKVYTFERDNYAVHLTVTVNNPTGKTWSGSLYTQITRKKIEEAHQSHFYTRSYDGPAISSPQVPYEKVPYKSLERANINRENKDGWIAMQQHYFLSAWVPGDAEQTHRYYSHVIPATNIYVIGFVSPQMTVKPNASAESSATLYVGPEIASQLHTVAPNLDRTIDYGWLWFISILLFWVMNAIHTIVKNWGWSIVITTIVIKIIFYWFSAKSFRSMARLREMQPKLALLKERYGDDKQAMSKATMELYRKEKINPLGGCLPMIIQIPVFIAFYYVIIESVQLRQAPFIFWIHDLSMKDPYYILPILMGLSMLLQQWLSPTSADPTQQKMMWILPIVFTVFFINFPSGLVLYWLTNNLVQSLQQWYVNKTYEKHKAKVHAKKMKKKK